MSMAHLIGPSAKDMSGKLMPVALSVTFYRWHSVGTLIMQYGTRKRLGTREQNNSHFYFITHGNVAYNSSGLRYKTKREDKPTHLKANFKFLNR
jgi:hypothetical protein